MMTTYHSDVVARCLRCNRKLKSEESKAAGYGPSCLEKVGIENGEDLFSVMGVDFMQGRTKYKSKAHANRGKVLEKYINMSNEYYRVHNLADVYQQHAEVKVGRGNDGQIEGATFSGQSGLDYIGVTNGLAITFDAKQTSADALPMSNIKPHQYRSMLRFERNGGTSFLIVHFKKHGETFVVPCEHVEVHYHSRKSLKIGYAREHCISVSAGRNLTLDYLAAIEVES